MRGKELERFRKKLGQISTTTIVGIPLLLSSHLQNPAPQIAESPAPSISIPSDFLQETNLSQLTDVRDFDKTPKTDSPGKIQDTPAQLSVVTENNSLGETKPQDRQLNDIINKVTSHPEVPSLFGRGLNMQDIIEDLNTYWNIYVDVGKAYNLDPELLWMNHEVETGASRNTTANPRYVGAMQRDPGFFGQTYVSKAFYGKGLGYLEDTPGQRDPSDAREIAAGASIIVDWEKQTDGTILSALRGYGSGGDFKYNIYLKLKQIFQ